MEVGAIGKRAGRPGGGWCAVETGLQGVIGQGLDVGPLQPGVGRPAEDPGHGPKTDREARGHLPVAPGQGPLLTEDLSDLTHR